MNYASKRAGAVLCSEWHWLMLSVCAVHGQVDCEYDFLGGDYPRKLWVCFELTLKKLLPLLCWQRSLTELLAFCAGKANLPGSISE